MEMANGGGMMGGGGGSGSGGLDRVADNAVQVAVIVRVRLRPDEPLLRLPHRRRKRDEPRRRGKRSAAARTTLLFRSKTSVVEPPALAGVLVVPW